LAEAAGPFTAGCRYRANDLAALRWVHATLIDTALVAHELVHPPLSAEDCERYWGEARLFAAFFGIPQDALPPSWGDFVCYNETMWRSDVLTVSDAARKRPLGWSSGAGTWLPCRPVSRLDGKAAVGSAARRFCAALRRRGEPEDRSGARRPSARVPEDAELVAPCRAIPGGTGAARRAAARNYN
jgi:uncharacterized protein (DUF2236 family)